MIFWWFTLAKFVTEAKVNCTKASLRKYNDWLR